MKKKNVLPSYNDLHKLRWSSAPVFCMDDRHGNRNDINNRAREQRILSLPQTPEALLSLRGAHQVSGGMELWRRSIHVSGAATSLGAGTSARTQSPPPFERQKSGLIHINRNVGWSKQRMSTPPPPFPTRVPAVSSSSALAPG